MYEFTDKYENKINFEEEEYERNDLVQVWSVEKNPLSEEDRAFDNPKAPVIERRTFKAPYRELMERTVYDSTGKKVPEKEK